MTPGVTRRPVASRIVRIGRLVLAGVWFALGFTALAALLQPAAGGDAASIALVLLAVLPPFSIGAGCLLIRGLAIQVLMTGGFLIGVVYLVLAVLGLRSGAVAPLSEVWAYLIIAAPIALLVWGVLALAVDRVSAPPPLDEMADLEAAHASGAVSDALYPFEKAKLHFAQTGYRRVFACGRCGKPISLAWHRCDHCQATFDEFPPIPTGEEINATRDAGDLFTGW
jgi:hypothetical protein